MTAALLALARSKMLSYHQKKALMDRWKTAIRVIEAAQQGLSRDPEEAEIFKIILSQVNIKEAEREVDQVRAMGGWILGYGMEGYPSLLKEIPDPPLVLFGRGVLPKETLTFLGFVGSRRPSSYGRRIAKMLAEDLAQEGIILVSGLARGIDAICHEAALRNRVPTIAVIGCGLDRVYPPEHAHLQSQIEQNGAIISEFFLGEPPRKENFPRRNRVISGLSKGVLVIEAGEKSGARITASHAVEQNREVFAVPGPIDSPLSIFTNKLISDGAKLVLNSADILEELIPDFESHKKRRNVKEIQSTLSDEQRHLLNCLERDMPVAPEVLAHGVDLSVRKVLQTLTELEILGLVEKQPDTRYVRISI